MFKLLKDKLWSKNWYTSPIILFSMMIFFWGLFDAILTYATPIIMEESGMSLSMIGIIIGTSSITGAIFDYIFCRIFKNIRVKKVKDRRVMRYDIFLMFFGKFSINKTKPAAEII